MFKALPSLLTDYKPVRVVNPRECLRRPLHRFCPAEPSAVTLSDIRACIGTRLRSEESASGLAVCYVVGLYAVLLSSCRLTCLQRGYCHIFLAFAESIKYLCTATVWSVRVYPCLAEWAMGMGLPGCATRLRHAGKPLFRCIDEQQHQ